MLGMKGITREFSDRMKLLRAEDKSLKEFSIDFRASRDTETGDGNETFSLSLSLTHARTRTNIHT